MVRAVSIYRSQMRVPEYRAPEIRPVDVSSGLQEVAGNLAELGQRQRATKLNDAELGMAEDFANLRDELREVPWDKKEEAFRSKAMAIQQKRVNASGDNWVREQALTSYRRQLLTQQEHVRQDVFEGQAAHEIGRTNEALDRFAKEAAAARSPDERAIALENGRKAVGNLVASGFIDDVRGRQTVSQFLGNADLYTARVLVDKSPHAAARVFADPEKWQRSFPNLDPLQAVALSRDASSEARQRDNEARARAAAASAAAASDLAVAVNRFRNGQGEFDQATLETYRGKLSHDTFNRLQIQFDDARAYREGQSADMAAVSALIDGGGHVDPGNQKQVKAFDQYFKAQVLPELEKAPNPEAAMVDFIGKHGIVPDSLKASVRGALRSGNAQEKADASRFLDQVKAVAPQAIGDFAEEDIRAGNLVSAYVDGGATPQQAVQLTEEALRRPKEISDALDKTYDTLTKDDKTSDWLAYQNSGWWSRPEVGQDVAVQVDRTVRNEFLRNGGNLEAARRTALDMTRKRFGPTTVNGTWQVTRNPIEQHYGVPWKTPEENAAAIKREAVDDLRKGGATDGPLTEDRVRILPYPVKGITAPDGRPVYGVEVQDSSGAWTVQVDMNPKSRTFGLPKPWAPSLAKVREERQAEIDAAIDEAKTSRLPLTERLKKPGAGTWPELRN